MDRIILTTGGTGGHIFPAVAVAQEIRRRNPQTEILFIGSIYGPESHITSQAGIPFRGLPVRGFLGRGWRAIPAAWALAAALFSALKIIRSFKPDAIAGFGGYASFAPALAGSLLKIPLLLHEQNALAGTSNRYLARFAKVLCASLPSTRNFENPVVTGNPIRDDIKLVAKARALKERQNTRRLLVLGGSQGAKGINEIMARMLPALRQAGVEIRHQTGVKDLEKIRKRYIEAGYSPDCVAPFMDNMGEQYVWADLVFCRSGASTVAELCACGLPAILTPFPAAIHNHQMLNARILESAGAARIIEEKELAPDAMAALVTGLIVDKEKLESMSKAALSLARPDAAALLTDELEKIANSSGCGQI